MEMCLGCQVAVMVLRPTYTSMSTSRDIVSSLHRPTLPCYTTVGSPPHRSNLRAALASHVPLCRALPCSSLASRHQLCSSVLGPFPGSPTTGVARLAGLHHRAPPTSHAPPAAVETGSRSSRSGTTDATFAPMANLPHYLYLHLGERRIHLWERLIRRALAISDHHGPAMPCAALSSRIEDELRRISLYLPPPSQLVARLSSSGDDGYRDVDSDNCQRDHKWRGGVGHRQWRDECARPYAYAPLVSSRGNGSGRIPSTRYFKTVVRLLGDNDLPGFFEMYATENPTPSVGSWQAATNVGGSAQPTTMEEDVRESDMFDNEEEYVGVGAPEVEVIDEDP
uniref:Uncharacterized protein n=1 Tax=Oryza sativa subsp. japonica TaxID=39947 RepID=Q9AYF9_ORYSJ|nr:Hypothetical protein [Oryza sativa Japonica Group]